MLPKSSISTPLGQNDAFQFLPRIGYVQPSDTKVAKSKRASFFTRLCASTLDLSCGVCFSTLIQGFLLGEQRFLGLQICILFYYLATEFIWGQTLGKIFFGLELVSLNSPLTTNRIMLRWLIRAAAIFFPPLCIPLACSWRRITGLDLFSNLRVISRRDAAPTRSSPFNEDMLQR